MASNRAKVKFSVDGLENLKRVLKDTTKRVAVEELNKAVRETCEKVLASARANCPVDRGDLRNAMDFTLGPRSLIGRVGIGGNPVSSRGGKSSHQHPSVYGIFQEFGTSRKNSPAKRFMRNALEQQQTFFIQAITRSGSRLENRLDVGNSTAA